MQWKGRAKFVRIFERYLDVSRNTDGTLPAYFYDGSNPQALSGQLGWYAQSTCYEMRTCSNALMAKFASMSMGYGEYIQAIGAGGPDGQGAQRVPQMDEVVMLDG